MSPPIASTSTASDRPVTPARPPGRGRSSGSESSTRYGAISIPQTSAKQALLAAASLSDNDAEHNPWLKPHRSGGKHHPREGSRTRFQPRSRERSADVFDSDAEYSSDEEGNRPGGRRFSRTRAASGTGSIWSRMTVGRDDDEESLVEESDKQWGVLQMELIQRTRGKRGLIGIYFG